MVGTRTLGRGVAKAMVAERMGRGVGKQRLETKPKEKRKEQARGKAKRGRGRVSRWSYWTKPGMTS